MELHCNLKNLKSWFSHENIEKIKQKHKKSLNKKKDIYIQKREEKCTALKVFPIPSVCFSWWYFLLYTLVFANSSSPLLFVGQSVQCPLWLLAGSELQPTMWNWQSSCHSGWRRVERPAWDWPSPPPEEETLTSFLRADFCVQNFPNDKKCVNSNLQPKISFCDKGE